LVVNDWFTAEQYQIESVETADGNVLTNKQLQLMIDEMAAFGGDAGSVSDQTNAGTNTNNANADQMWITE
ncbi:MAG: hypothetical protein IJB96_03015, partial [Lachnospira sp.]|nr:hypothetical protein [Lachnospira sp.]